MHRPGSAPVAARRFPLRPAHCALLLAACLPGSQLAGQSAWSVAFTPPGHWAVDAVHRLAGFGLTPAGFDVTSGTLTQLELGRALEHAVDAALPGTPHAELATDYLQRFRTELGPGDIEQPWLELVLAGSSAEADYVEHRGRAATGWGYEDGHLYGDWNDALPLPDDASARLGAAFQVSAFEAVGLRLALRHEDGFSVDEGYLSVRLAGVVLWAGRHVVDWSPGVAEGLLVTKAPLDGVGLQTAQAFRLPWILRHVGPIQFELGLGRRDFINPCEDATRPQTGVACSDAWFLTTRAMVAPHQRLALGISRAAFFGGEGNTEVDAFALFSVLIGKHAGRVSELDNQLVAFDVTYRPPVERWLPVRLYLEWGFEDSAGAWTNVPGLLAGIDVPAVPGVPALALAVERISFARSCCSNPIWYRHSVFHDGWTIDRRPLGHPLGGHGSEWAVISRLDASRARVRLVGRLFLRNRGEENLFSLTRQGSSTGFGARAEWSIGDRGELFAGAEFDHGEGWREERATLGLRTFF